MKIALCSDWYSKVGGISSHIRELAKSLSKRGHDVTIITVKKVEEAEDTNHHNVRVIRVSGAVIPGLKILSPLSLSDVKDALLGEKFDIIHVHHAFIPISLYSVSVASKYGIPSVLTAHSLGVAHENHYLWRFLRVFMYPIRKTLENVNRIITVSEAVRRFMKHLLPDYERFVVIPNAVDIEEFKPNKSKEELRRELCLPIDNPIILFVGRLVVRKGVHVLLDAFRSVVKEIPDARLVIVGKGMLRDYLEYKAKAYGIERNVDLRGYVDRENLVKLYMAADVFVCPSIFAEAFGIVIIEAMAAGKPVIATRVGGIPEIIDDGIDGILVKPHSVRELSDAIIWLLNDKSRLEAMGMNAREKVEERYSWDRVVHRVVEVYEEVMGVTDTGAHI
ncbi:MAG: glycosyltransferase family 4 protein [Candidatus Baldrarchaeia archaeon]